MIVTLFNIGLRKKPCRWLLKSSSYNYHIRKDQMNSLCRPSMAQQELLLCTVIESYSNRIRWDWSLICTCKANLILQHILHQRNEVDFQLVMSLMTTLIWKKSKAVMFTPTVSIYDVYASRENETYQGHLFLSLKGICRVTISENFSTVWNMVFPAKVHYSIKLTKWCTSSTNEVCN